MYGLHTIEQKRSSLYNVTCYILSQDNSDSLSKSIMETIRMHINIRDKLLKVVNKQIDFH